MSTFPLKDSDGKSLGERTLGGQFDVQERGAHALYLTLVAHQAHQHQGSSSSLGKGAVSGSGAKPWKQKGGGRARAGYKQSPVWRGGAAAFGPHPRKVRKHLPRKVTRLAFARAFAEKVEAGAVTGINELKLETPRTKELCTRLNALNISGKVLLVIDAPDTNIFLAARNLKGVEVVCAENINTYQIVRYPQIVVTETAMKKIEERVA
jgi:large subunit ribosomal protein L4